MSGASAVAARLYERPVLRRATRLVVLLWLGALWSLAAAPSAAAAGMGWAMSWTGLYDSHGVPVGAYFVSVVPMMEAVREQGPSFGVDPSSWAPALMSSMSTMMTYTQLSLWLSMECAFLVFVGSAAIWFVKFALSAQWLGWLAAIAEPLVNTVSDLVARLYVMPIALLVCCVVGGVVALTKAVGRGVGIILGGFLIVLASAALLHDPVTELVSDNGVLGIGRTLGFAVAEGGFHNGPLAPGGSTAQLDALGSWLCDVLLRQQIQLINFGMVVDDAGCGQVWDTAIMSGQSAAPAHAMASCAPAALAHAQQLDASAVGLFAMLIVAVLIVTCALIYIGCEVFRIGFKAFVNLLVIIPAAAVAVAPGPPRRFAARTAVKLVVHGVEMLAATAGLGIVVIIMSEVTRGSVPGMIGMDHPLAKLFVMMLLAVAGALGFRHLLHAFGDPGIPGPVHVLGSAFGRVARAGETWKNFDYVPRRSRDLWRWLIDSQRQQQPTPAQGNGPVVPGRRGHPPPSHGPVAGGNPPPGVPPPGRGPSGGSGSGVTAAQANQATGGGRPGPAATSPSGQPSGTASPASSAARTAATMAAPEAAAAATIAERVAQRTPTARQQGSGAGRRAETGPGWAVGSSAPAQPPSPPRALPPGRGHGTTSRPAPSPPPGGGGEHRDRRRNAPPARPSSGPEPRS